MNDVEAMSDICMCGHPRGSHLSFGTPRMDGCMVKRRLRWWEKALTIAPQPPELTFCLCSKFRPRPSSAT